MYTIYTTDLIGLILLPGVQGLAEKLQLVPAEQLSIGGVF